MPRAVIAKRTRLVVALVLLLAGCGAVERTIMPEVTRPARTAAQAGSSRLVLYLNGPTQAPLEVAFDIAAIDAVRADGFRAPVWTGATTIDSLQVVERQRLLAEAFIPLGRYTGLAFRVARARVMREGRLVDLSVPPDPIVVPTGFEMRRGDATPLFLTWDVGRAIEGEVFFRGALALEGRAQELRGVLAYVTNEGSDTLSVIDRHTDRVVSVLEMERGPRGVAVSADATRAYVVNSAANTLSIIDVNISQVIHRTNLEVGSGASDVVVTPDGGTLYVSNTALNSVSAINTTSFQIVQSIPVGLGPVSLVLVPGRPLVIAANTRSQTLSVVDTTRNAVVATIPVDFQPSRLSTDAAGTQAFVPHLASPRLAVVSLSTLRVVRTVNAGSASAALPESQTSSARLFLARPQLPRLSLFDITLNAEVHAIPVGDQPRDPALDPDREKLYVVNRGSGTVTIIDRNSLTVRATVDVGARPYAIAIIP